MTPLVVPTSKLCLNVPPREKGQAYPDLVRLPFGLPLRGVAVSDAALLRAADALAQSGTHGQQIEHVDFTVAVYVG